MKKEISVSKDQLEAFGKRVRSIREQLHLKQKEFAVKLEISESYICQIEKGNANPTFEFFHKLTSKLSVNLNYLFYGEGKIFYKDRSSPEIEAMEEPLETIETYDELLWLLEHSGYFRLGMIFEAKRFLSGDHIEHVEKDLARERGKRKKS